MVVWITGLSGSGKTTVSTLLADMLRRTRPNVVTLDGDIVRALFGNDLGHAEDDRKVQIRRIQTLAAELDRQGQIVLVAALYAHPELLAWNRRSFAGYFEVVLDAGIDLVRQRDPKGLYARMAGVERPSVVGIDIPWHAPAAADLTIDMAGELSAQGTARTIYDRLAPLLALGDRERADA